MIDLACGAVEPDVGGRANRHSGRCGYAARGVFRRPSSAEGGEALIMVEGKNISVGGMCVVSGADLGVGSSGTLLVQQSTGRHVVLSARVVYCRRVAVGRYDCGLALFEGPSGASIDDFRAAGDVLDLPRSAAA